MLPLLDFISPGGSSGKLSILIYHRVHPSVDPMHPGEVDATAFTWQMRLVRRAFNVLPLGEAVHRLAQNRLPARSLSITFDDGYADNHDVALGILRDLDLKATFFIASGFLDGGRMWNDSVIESIRRAAPGSLDLEDAGLGRFSLGTWGERRNACEAIITDIKHRDQGERQRITDLIVEKTGCALPDDLMLSTEQVVRLHSAGMEIGAHTLTHPILARLSADRARAEITDSRRQLEDIIGARVTLFAYPNGKPGVDYLPQHVEMVKEAGFDAAVSTRWGVSTLRTERMELRRFTPWDKNRTMFLLRLLRNCSLTD